MSARILYPAGFGEGDEIVMYDRGNFEAVIEADGKKYSILFRAFYHIEQDLRVRERIGIHCVAIPRLVIVEDVTVEIIEKAVNRLYADEYFKLLIPISE